MKKILTAILTIIIAISFPGCASTNIKHLSGPEFVKKAQEFNPTSTPIWTHYLGEGRDRVYLEYVYPALFWGGDIVTIYWTETSDLPLDYSIKLRNGALPWENETEPSPFPDLLTYPQKVADPLKMNLKIE